GRYANAALGRIARSGSAIRPRSLPGHASDRAHRASRGGRCGGRLPRARERFVRHGRGLDRRWGIADFDRRRAARCNGVLKEEVTMKSSENDREVFEPTPAVYNPPPGLDRALRALPPVPLARPAPRRIGYLVNYSFHIWYQILMEVMR